MLLSRHFTEHADHFRRKDTLLKNLNHALIEQEAAVQSLSETLSKFRRQERSARL